MLQTNNLFLDKAKFSDWAEMYKNVWSRPESCKYMSWKVTTNEEDAKIRINKTIEWQKNHDTYFVYEKTTGKAIGFAGVEKLSDNVYQEVGICLGPDYVGKGYGKQILKCLIDYCAELGAKEFIYSTREANEASKGLARSLGFTLVEAKEKTCEKTGQIYTYQKYCLKL